MPPLTKLAESQPSARRDISLIVQRLPSEVTERSTDNFLSAYLDAREANGELTVAQFFAPFDHIRETLHANYGIEIDERVEEDVLVADTDHCAAGDAMRRNVVATRRYAKSESAIRHDIAEYIIVQRERAQNRRTWLLTQDRSLIYAGAELCAEGDQPYSISLAGLLQTLSPYVTAAEEQSFADVFSKLLLDIVPPLEDVYDIDDLRVLAKIQDDVDCTSPEKLVEAYDYVRRELGAQADRQDPAQIVLGLRRFLTSSDEEQKRALTAQLEQVRLEKQRAAEEAAERQEESRRFRIHDKERNAQLERERDAARLESTRLNDELRQERLNANRGRRQRSMYLLFGGMAAASLLWLIADVLAMALAVKYGISRANARLLLNALAAIAFVAPVVWFVRTWRPAIEVSIGLLSISFAVALLFSGVIADALGSTMSSLLQIASAASLLLAPALTRKPNSSPGG